MSPLELMVEKITVMGTAGKLGGTYIMGGSIKNLFLCANALKLDLWHSRPDEKIGGIELLVAIKILVGIKNFPLIHSNVLH